ncbi:Mu transposase C-terminal domain-containing protein [Nonomuraea sp. NPDC046802]|uniref:Mu transposase C-terminal domain-containing protein n=1 Tax=Nonomuraea sp. NPDC046802 TaxID=3154919 RepID=UPI0033F2A079
MTVSRPPDLRVGDEVRFTGANHTITAVTGHRIGLADIEGTVFEVDRVALFTDPGFAVLSTTRAPLPGQGLLDELPAEVVEQARWWELHIIEVLTDLTGSTLRQRELAKVAELKAQGYKVALSTFQRLRLTYETRGLSGLVDQRAARARSLKTDLRVVEAIGEAVLGETNRSTGTAGRLRRRVEQILAERHELSSAQVAEIMPPRTTFYRLVERATTGKHTFGSARTRRSTAKPPDGPFGGVAALRPGEWMQVDSTPLNVRVVLDNGLVDRVELTWLIDQATKTIPAAVLRPTTKAVDAAVLLARSLTPEPMRPGWVDALRMSRSVLPHRRLTAIDERLEHAAARPVIVPETIVFDHGKAFTSQTFWNACRAMAINHQPTHEGSPWEKGMVESSFSSVDTLFAQYVAGFVGNSVENRGENAGAEAVWSMLELQELLDEWIVADWQNRPHEGLRDPLIPGKAMTPNEKYAALIETAGYVPVPLSESDYIELLPVTWRAINTYGIKIKHRKYDCKALARYRRQHSGVITKKGLWEVHHDPYDVSRIWVRDHRKGGWITVPWTLLKSAPIPFGEQAWDHGRRILAERGNRDPTEAEIAQAVNELLTKAGRGPDQTVAKARSSRKSTKTERLAARTRATNASPVLPAAPPAPEEPEPAAETQPRERLAKVIPLGAFNAHEEARKRR